MARKESAETMQNMTRESILENLNHGNEEYNECLRERESLVDEINMCRMDLKGKERLLEKQDRKLDRLKFFIDKETEQQEQLMETLKQHSRPANVKTKLQNTAELLGKYKTEEQEIIKDNLETLQEIRDSNNAILKKLDEINKVDSLIASKKKRNTLLKQRLNKLQL
eukprot:gene7233-8041_t